MTTSSPESMDNDNDWEETPSLGRGVSKNGASPTWDINSKPFKGEDDQMISTLSTVGEIEMGAPTTWENTWRQIETESSGTSPTGEDMRAQIMEKPMASERPLVACMESNESSDFEDGRGQADGPESAWEADPPKTSRRTRRTNRSSIWKFEEYELPESTYTLLITSEVLSLSCLVGILAAALSIISLSIVLFNVITSDTEYSDLGIPGGVKGEVLAAQYIGVIVGVLMEEEIPLGLEIMGKCIEQGKLGRYPFEPAKVFISCLLRLVVGYMFLASLFLTVIQNSDVLDIFFDVLALEFVEKLDDALYLLLKRGFFGKRLRVASYTPHTYLPPGDEATNTFAKRVKIFIRIVYFFNAFLMIFGITYIMSQQLGGEFRCRSISISIADDVWEESWVQVDGGDPQKRLLIYSHFNGIYKENGTHDFRPKYTEQNKEGHTGMPYQRTIGAEIIYCKVNPKSCKALKAWVFRHELIRTSPFDEEEENECSWLLRSPETDSFDIIEVAQEGSWDVWTGQIRSESSMSITCNECSSNADCNHHGDCNTDQRMCQCGGKYFGVHCEFNGPCEVIRSVKDSNTTLHLLHDKEDDEDHFVEVYGHPKYEANMRGIPTGLMRLGHSNDDAYIDDDFFEIHNELDAFQKLLMNYTFSLRYTGRRWYGQILPPGLTSRTFDENEYHAFWDKSFSGLGVDDNATVIISAPTTDASPVGIDFYEMRRRNRHFETGVTNYNYGPFGVLLELVGAEGAGYFHCNRDDRGDGYADTDVFGL